MKTTPFPINQASRPILLVLFLLIVCFSHAQDAETIFSRSFQNGSQLYNLSRWHEAASEFRRAQENTASVNEWSSALYWVILSQLAYSDYGSALKDMDELEKYASNSVYARDMVYHRARAYFNLGYFNEALLLFKQYIDSVTDDDPVTLDRIAAAYFWMGESLYTMQQYDEAERFYTWVTDRFPESPKREISLYRIDLIRQKKIEAELLALLQWSHEESLRTSEDYQRRLRTYEAALNAFQLRIAELTQNPGLPAADTHARQELIPVDTPVQNESSLYERLLERARQLNMELDILISDYISGGSM